MTTAPNTMGGETPRDELDRYLTDPAVAKAMCERLRQEIGTPRVIIEPSAGGGAFVRAARRVWGLTPHIIAIEVDHRRNQRALEQAGADVVLFGRWENCHEEVPRPGLEDTVLIVGNPPFDLPEDKRLREKLPFHRKGEVPVTGERHVRLALERLGHFESRVPVPRYLAFLMRQSFKGGPRVGRGRLFGPGSAGGLRWRWDISPRPSFTEDGNTDGAEYNALVWQAGYSGAYEGGDIIAPDGGWRPD